MHYIFLIFFLNINILFSETIDFIQVEGNKKTKNYIILRELKQQVNDTWSAETMATDKNRVYNLGLFSSVEIEVKNTNEQNIYIVRVSEKWYVWPFPIVKYDNRIDQVSSYGGGLIHQNFRGRDEDVSAGATAGQVSEYFLWYSNPWISGDHNSLDITIYDQSSDHHVYSIVEDDKGMYVEGGFYKGYNHKFNFWLNYNNKVIDFFDDEQLVAAPFESDYIGQTKYSYLRIGSQYRYDTRDIYIDPNSGIFLDIEFNHLFGFYDTDDMFDIELDFNIYKSFFSYLGSVFKYNFFSNIQYSKSELPIFKKNYIGGQSYVRGYSAIPSNNEIANATERIEVENFLINSFEIQSTLINRKEYLDQVEMGIDFVLFADYGIGYNLNKSINWNNSLFGYGLGLKIFLMGAVIKFDYALNMHGTSRWHLF
tara:strand:- start:273 stop:1544 length:1272 start_codon:yes stop_codon:yes gene_type:complete